ncbi:winged helix-turn-helix transcriptional regulator [Sphingobacterium siyangense]|jgi:DNA-binding HxlR family transcriptional regulator|uniref:winged helix-turn-helix transcriptional regulator n=1 Tax=Sphingobacterium siyangense TaxID=459529 RepID=UPI0028ADF047|nr:helix-turn-helix domain-containing protein [Sphingobacterium siyangense]
MTDRKENSTNAINEKTLQQFCNASKTLALFSGRWKLSILFKLLEQDTNYSEFKILLPQVSDRTLAKQLKELQLDGLIQKDRSKTASVYSLTDKSHQLKPLLVALSGFNNDHP